VNKNQVDKVVRDVIEFINSGPIDDNDFGRVALSLYDLHREYNPTYKKYEIGELKDWREIPLMPISEFKNSDVGLKFETQMPFPGVEFHSSGTTKGDKSKHRMYDTEAYRASIANGFKVSVEPALYPRYRVVLLTPELPNSSLYYMMSYISELHDRRGTREVFSQLTNIEAVRSLMEDDLSWEVETPVLLFGTSLAFYDLMESMEKAEVKPFKLPEGSMMIETGGWKGRDIKLSPRELTTKVSVNLGIDFDNCIREYSMSEMSSQLWSWGNDYTVGYVWPDWLNVRLVDPLTQTEVKEGESGIIAFVDLANVWSCPFILTEDMGHLYYVDKGFEKLVLEGRAVNAPEKGCSLTYAQNTEKLDS